MNRLLLFIAAIVATVSCTNEIAETPNMEEATTQTISVAVAANSTTDTRVDVADDGEGGYTVTWNASDALGAWGTGDTAYYQSKFTIASDDDYDAENSTFTGELPYNTTEIRFIHPYNGIFSQTNGVVSMSLASQSVTSDLTNLSSNTYMVSNAFDVASVTSSTTDIKSGISMSHLGAAIDLRIKLDDSSDFTLTQFVISGLPTAAEVDMTNDATLTVTKTGAITLAMDNIASVDGVATASFNSFPFTLAAGEALSFEATLFDSDEKYYTATATITASEEVAFSRATRNTVYVKLSDVVATETPQETITITHDDFSDYSTTSTTFTGEIELGGADFYANSIYAYNSTYVSAGTSGYLLNLTSLEGLSKLVISYSSSNYFTVYEGSAVNPLASVVTPSVDEDTYVCTYEITKGNTFFTIVRATTSYVNAYSIVAHYDTLGATSKIPASFTGLNPSTIIFDSDDTTAQTVTINGSYLENGTISVSVDSSNFKVSSVASDYTFTVAPVAANNTDAAYSATVTVTVDETVYTMTVSQVGTSAAQEYITWSLTAANIDTAIGSTSTSGYAKYNGDHYPYTDDKIYYYTDGVMVGSSALQFRSSDPGYLYNTTEMIGISKIVLVTQKDMSVNVYVGTEQNPTATALTATSTTNDTETTYTYLVVGDYKYFTILSNGGGTSYIDSVTVSYVEAGADPKFQAELTSLSPSAISFDYNSTAAQTISINGVYLDNAESITATIDSDKFTVSEISDDYTFTVAPVGQNDSEEAYTATVTVTVDGNEQTLTVSQLSEGEAAPTYVLVESVDDITDGEYLLACAKDGVMYIADGTNTSTSYLVCISNGMDYYDSTNKSFTSNSTIDGYAVTIATTTDSGYSIKMSNDTYVKWSSSSTSLGFQTDEYYWTADSDASYGVYLYDVLAATTTSTGRYIGILTSGPTMRAYASTNSKATNPPTNLYKKVTE